MELAIRRRVKVSRTKNGYSTECSVDAEGMSNGEVVVEAHELMVMLEARFPTEVPKVD